MNTTTHNPNLDLLDLIATKIAADFAGATARIEVYGRGPDYDGDDNDDDPFVGSCNVNITAADGITCLLGFNGPTTGVYSGGFADEAEYKATLATWSEPADEDFLAAPFFHDESKEPERLAEQYVAEFFPDVELDEEEGPDLVEAVERLLSAEVAKLLPVGANRVS